MNQLSYYLKLWRKIRIEIHSEQIRIIPESVSEPNRIHSSQSEEQFKKV